MRVNWLEPDSIIDRDPWCAEPKCLDAFDKGISLCHRADRTKSHAMDLAVIDARGDNPGLAQSRPLDFLQDLGRIGSIRERTKLQENARVFG